MSFLYSKEKKAWHEVKLRKRFENAWRGMRVYYETSNHFYILVICSLLSVIFGFLFGISELEWVAIFFSIGFVFVSEIFNTAIEIDIDLTSPEYHPYARDTKDVAAAAAVFSMVIALIVGIIIFLPKIFSCI